jgi:ABC-type branched-subunit amino acid transport system substrate-binding protein
MKWVEAQGYKSCANLYIDIAYGHSESDIYNARWGQPGSAVELKEEIFYPFGSVDIGPEIAKLVESNPDVINLGIWGGEAGIVVAKKLNELGWTGPVIVGIGCLNTEFINSLGSLCEGWIDADNWVVNPNDPLNWQFAQNYKELNGRLPDSWGATAYTGVKSLLLAMNKAGTVDDVNKIADAMFEENWDSPLGKVKFLPGGQIFMDKCYLVHVQEGKIELLDTPALSLEDYTSPHNWYSFISNP